MHVKLKKGIIALIILTLLICGAVFTYMKFGPDAVANTDMKKISVTVYHGDGTEKSFELLTKAETLSNALVEANLISGEDGPYGIYILTVDGETVDASAQQWWCITKDGNQHNQGASETIIANGESYELSFKEGW